MEVRYIASKEGLRALYREQVFGWIYAALRNGGDYWCRTAYNSAIRKGFDECGAKAEIERDLRQFVEDRDAAIVVTPAEGLSASRDSPTLASGERRLTQLCNAEWIAKQNAKRRPHRRKFNPSAVAAAIIGKAKHTVRRTPVLDVAEGAAGNVVAPSVRKAKRARNLVEHNNVTCPWCGITIQRARKHVNRRHGRDPELLKLLLKLQRRSGRAANSKAASMENNRRDESASTSPSERRQRSAKKRKKKGTAASAGRKGRTVRSHAPRGRESEFDREAREERRADATRYYAAVYREHGRFGSHASHDAYGDDDRA